MKRIKDIVLRILFSRALLYIVGMLVAAALIWFIGPLLGVAGSEPLSGALARMLAITLIPALLGLGATFSNFRYARVNQELQQSLTETPKAKAEAAGAEETAELGGRLKEALELLKKTKVRRSWGSGWLYELPWYMFIGPPGSGKTTALVNSGLTFPLAGDAGKKIRGVGGTRTCDWWFTDEAVLIDTAGRYTTQDSDAAVDASAWNGFLRLLKKYRKRQPINGAIVAIGLPDLIEATEQQRAEHALAIRTRLNELRQELGVRFPVYVLFTKLDRLAGFVEFFDDLGREGREQVWGITFPSVKAGEEGALVDKYAEEFDGLVGRLDQRLVERLQLEADIQRRALIFGFPQQVASVKELTDAFLKEIFAPTRFQQPARLRGVYFTSGTQFGTPIDRLMGAVASNFGISRQQIAAFSGGGRSYFLTRLIRNVIFGEAGLVSVDTKVEKRARRFHHTILGAAAAAVVLVTLCWVFAYFDNTATVEQIEQQAAAYDARTKNVALERVGDSDLRPILPLLEAARQLPGGYEHRDDTTSLIRQLGLYQGDKLGSQAVAVYRRILNRLLLPRVLLRLEQQLAQSQARPDELYGALKVYLMLGQQGKLDRPFVKLWMTRDWATLFPGAENEDTRTALLAHLDALLERPLTSYPLNAPLIDQSRSVLLRVPVAEYAYRLIKDNPKILALPPWIISEHAGPEAARALVRVSGRSLAEGIPGLYTRDGYFFSFKPLLPEAAKEIAKESWVLGARSKLADDPASVSRLQRDVTNLYLDDFAGQWERFLADIGIVSFKGTVEELQVLNALSAPDSPLKAILVSAANETSLSQAPERPSAPANSLSEAQQLAAQQLEQAAQKKVPKGSAAGLSLAEQQLNVTLPGQGGAADDIAGPFTDQRFKALHELALGNGQSPPAIDATVKNLGELYLAVNRSAPSADVSKVVDKLKADNARLPPSLQGPIATLTKEATGQTVDDTRDRLNALWTASVVPFCVSALDNRYPAFKSASNEVTLDDFAHLLGKGGLVDSFFDANLRPYVDMSKNPWVWQKLNNTELGIPQAALTQFQRAAAIRDSMFANGGNKPGVSFELLPISLDAKSTKVTVEIDGQSLSYDHGPERAVKMTWPGPSGVGHVRIAFEPQGTGEATVIEKDGAWAWFRVLQASGLRRTTGADRYAVTFRVADRSASFEIRANSVINPFANNQLEGFRCPSKL